MGIISDLILLIMIIAFVTIVICLIIKTPSKDKGCTFDCKNCPFPECSNIDKENIIRLQTGDKE